MGCFSQHTIAFLHNIIIALTVLRSLVILRLRYIRTQQFNVRTCVVV